MTFPHAYLSEIVSGILVLAARGGEQIPIPKIHSVLCAMRSDEKILAGLFFSITGAICFSRQIEIALKELAAQGVLHLEEGSIAVVKNAKGMRARLGRMFPGAQYNRIRRASCRFYRSLHGKDAR